MTKAKKYKEWLKKTRNNRGRVFSPKTADSYASGVNTVSEHQSQITGRHVDFYNTADSQMATQIAPLYDIGECYQHVGEQSRGIIRCGIRMYARFIGQFGG